MSSDDTSHPPEETNTPSSDLKYRRRHQLRRTWNARPRGLPLVFFLFPPFASSTYVRGRFSCPLVALCLTLFSQQGLPRRLRVSRRLIIPPRCGLRAITVGRLVRRRGRDRGRVRQDELALVDEQVSRVGLRYHPAPGSAQGVPSVARHGKARSIEPRDGGIVEREPCLIDPSALRYTTKTTRTKTKTKIEFHALHRKPGHTIHVQYFNSPEVRAGLVLTKNKIKQDKSQQTGSSTILFAHSYLGSSLGSSTNQINTEVSKVQKKVNPFTALSIVIYLIVEGLHIKSIDQRATTLRLRVLYMDSNPFDITISRVVYVLWSIVINHSCNACIYDSTVNRRFLKG